MTTGVPDLGRRSFEEYAATRWASLHRFAHLLTGEPAAAEDLVQDTLIKVAAQWTKVRRADAPDAYVKKMLLNEFLAERRKVGRRAGRAHLVPVPAMATADPAGGAADRIDLWQQVQALPPRQRAVLVLRYYEDLTEAQIAEALGIAIGTVKSQAHQALATLRGRQGAPAASSHPSSDHSTEEVS